MASFGVDTRPAAAASGGGGGGAGTGEGALSFLSRSLREDLRLIRARAGELETFLNAPVAEPELLARLRRAYSSSASSARTRLDLSAIGKAFEAESWRGARGQAGWSWEEEAEEWEPVRLVKARLRELERRAQGQSASDMLQKVKLSLVRFPRTWDCTPLSILMLNIEKQATLPNSITALNLVLKNGVTSIRLQVGWELAL